MTNEKKIKPPSCKELQKWLKEIYIPYYNSVTQPQATDDDGGSNPNPKPPKPPGTGIGG